MTSVSTTRDGSGRFLQGAGGRPVGSKNKRKRVTAGEFKSAVAREVDEKLEGMLGLATSVLHEKLVDGDLRAALWLLNQSSASQSARLSEAIPSADLASLDGIVATAQQVVAMVADQRLTMTEASTFLRVLWSYAQMRGYMKVKELEEALTSIEKGNGAGDEASRLIKWGRLAAV